MHENLPSKKFAAPDEPTEKQSDFIETVLSGTDFEISDYSADRVDNTAKPENGLVASQIEVADSIIGGTPEENAALIRRVGEPTVPGIQVVEPISKLNIDPNVLKRTKTTEGDQNGQPVRIDQRLAPSTREKERAKARETSEARPWWKKIIGA